MKKDTFIKKWNGHVIEDWCIVISDDFKSFSRSFRSYMKTIADSCGATIVKYYVGHYDVSGFLEKDGKFVYFSYSEPRHLPINVYDRDCLRGVLYRKAKNADSSIWGANWFTSLADMDKDITRFLTRLAEGEDVA